MMAIFTLMNRKNRVVRSWDSVQPVIRFTRSFDGFVKEDELPIRNVETEGGEVFRIPYDPKTGLVSDVDLFQRFLDVWSGSGKVGGKRNVVIDIKKTATKNFESPEGGWTPEAVVECGWWARPNRSDIQGIDDLLGLLNFLDVSDGKKSMDGVGKKICVYASTPERRKEIQNILMDNFTDQELRSAVKNGGMVIMEGEAGPNAAGFYMGRQPGVDTPKIVLEYGADEDTITHEFVHHQRREDPYRGGVAKTPFPLDEKGYCHWERIPSKEFDSMQNLEEAATVAESAARTRKPCLHPTGYYAYTSAKDKGAKRQYDEDREALTGNRPLKGAKAVSAMENFHKTNISTLQYKRGGMQADSYLEYRKLKGDLPKAKERPKKKKKADATKGVIPKPMATANRKWKKI